MTHVAVLRLLYEKFVTWIIFIKASSFQDRNRSDLMQGGFLFIKGSCFLSADTNYRLLLSPCANIVVKMVRRSLFKSKPFHSLSNVTPFIKRLTC